MYILQLSIIRYLFYKKNDRQSINVIPYSMGFNGGKFHDIVWDQTAVVCWSDCCIKL